MTLTDRQWELLSFGLEAFPLPLPVPSIARAVFASEAGSARTAYNRALENLKTLAGLGLMSSTHGLARTGRPPQYWYPTRLAFRVVDGAGRLRPGHQKKARRTHLSKMRLLRRVHDLHTMRTLAEVHWLSRAGRWPIDLVEYTREASNWLGVESGVIPDLHCELEIAERPWSLLFEVQGSAPPIRAIEDKLSQYADALGSRAFAERHADKPVFVVFVTFSDDATGVDRRNNVVEAMADHGELLARTRVVSMHDLVEHGIMARIFYSPASFLAMRDNLSGTDRQHIAQARRRGNRVRRDRDQIVRARMVPQGLFERATVAVRAR